MTKRKEEEEGKVTREGKEYVTGRGGVGGRGGETFILWRKNPAFSPDAAAADNMSNN